MKMTRNVMEIKMAAAKAANVEPILNAIKLKEKGLTHSYFNPKEGKPDPMAWMGVKVLHKRTGRDTLSFQKAYAMG